MSSANNCLSSKGRKSGFDPLNLGSNPSEQAKTIYFYYYMCIITHTNTNESVAH